MKRRWICALGAAALGVYSWGQYRRARKAALENLRAGSDIIQTTCGPVEYARVGHGAPLLVLHGVLGNYAHGVISSRPLHEIFSVIAPSRPGYGRTPLTVGHSAAQQAAACAALLDALGIERVPLIAISGAGPAALQFALRYPDRCAGLILMSAISRPLDVTRLHLTWFFSLLVSLRRFDFGMWLAVNAVIHGLPLLRVLNPDLKQRIDDDPDGHALFTSLMRVFFPSSLARDGFANDVEMFTVETDDMLAQLKVPVLVLHGINDTVFPVEEARHTAAHIPGARLAIIEQGADHPFYITHYAVTWPLVAAFLQDVSD